MTYVTDMASRHNEDRQQISVLIQSAKKKILVLRSKESHEIDVLDSCSLKFHRALKTTLASLAG
jgi:hypothetical protein